MGVQGKKRLIAVFLFLAVFNMASGQDKEQTDSLVRLMKGSSVELIEKFGISYRKALDATFLHNGTYLICDTALWNVDSKVINAEGHVQIIQAETVLTSDKLDYLIDDNLAKFRGGLVQLQDKDNNTLRTRYLDYNTRDSVAIFSRGASMRDKDGQIIESLDGTYESRKKLFTFRNNVNMFTDSVFVKTNEMTYDTGRSRAEFKSDIDFWKDGNMLSARRGWYERPKELFFFRDRVHLLSETQEAWSDTMYFHRNSSNILMLHHAQVQDTTRNVFGLADSVFYEDSLSRLTMRRNAAIAIRTEQKEGEKVKVDTIYFGADTLIYRTVRKCDISEGEIKAAQERVAEIKVDPVSEYRRKAAQAAADAAAEAAKNNPNTPPVPAEKPRRNGPEKVGEPDGAGARTASMATEPAETGRVGADSLSVVSDSLAVGTDSLAVAADTLVVPDTSKVGFLQGRHHVRIFRKDMQALADSLLYNDLDSIARFFIDPIVWNEGTRQYSADSLFLLLHNGGADRASLMSNAFVATQEKDSLHFSQIKAPEILAYFDSTSALKRFDALGGATALFYLEENHTIATANKVEMKMMSAVMKNGTLDRVFYFESPKNDAVPVAQMKQDDKFLKGYKWNPELRPASKEDITSLVVRPTERERYSARPRTTFRFTDEYFPGYMKEVYRSIEIRDSIKKLPPKKDTLALHTDVADSLNVNSGKDAVDSLAVGAGTDSPAVSDSLAMRDSLATRDSLAVADSLTAKAPLDAKELRKQEMEKKRAERQAAREARWAELDKRDAAREAAKKERALERRRRLGRKILEQERRQAAADAAKLEKYKAMYEKRKAREEAKQARLSHKKKPPKETTENGENSQ